MSQGLPNVKELDQTSEEEVLQLIRAFSQMLREDVLDARENGLSYGDIMVMLILYGAIVADVHVKITAYEFMDYCVQCWNQSAALTGREQLDQIDINKLDIS